MSQHQLPTQSQQPQPQQAASAPFGSPAPAGVRPRTVASIVAAVLGGAVLLTVGTSAAIATVTSGGSGEGRSTAAVSAAGATKLDIEVGAGTVTVDYGSGSEAQIEATGWRTGDWVLRREGNTIEVRSPGGQFAGGSCLLGICSPERGQIARAKLTLPESFRDSTPEGRVRVGAGQATVDGDFSELEVTVEAGEATFVGAAETLNAKVGVGSFTGDVADVERSRIDVSVGEAKLVLTGAQPRDLDFKVNLGSIDATVPRGSYAVTANRSLGDFSNQLTVDSSSAHRVSVQTELGEVKLRAAR